MKRELAQKLEELINTGEYKVKITDHPYIDSFVDEIYEDEDGNYAYNSRVFPERKLATVPEWEVEVYRVVENWQTLKI